MSIEAINWAMQQRLRGVAPQCLLFVLANAADPEGVAFGWWKSSDHWWPYLIKHTRLARATIFNLLRELEEDGLLVREQIAPDNGGTSQPVVRLNFDKHVDEQTPSERKAQPAADALESESITETPETVGEASGGGLSPPHGLDPSGLAQVAVHGKDSFESIPWTGKESYIENPSPLNPPVPNGEAEGPAKKRDAPAPITEPIGFRTFWAQYPNHETDNRTKALAAFATLSEREQRDVREFVGLYAQQIAKTKRHAVSAWRWLAERRFTEYAPGASVANQQRWFVPDASEPWKAACALGAVAFATTPRIPQFWGAPGGAHVPVALMDNWRPWLVDWAAWVFVEEGTVQFGRWAQRIREMVNRVPVLVHVGKVDALNRRQHRLIGTDGDTWQPREYRGVMVPLEWPPARKAKDAKADQRAPAGADPPHELSEEDAREVVNF